MSNEVRSRVDQFFEAYRAAFEAWNAPAIADFFTLPLHITSDARDVSVTVMASRNDWIEQVNRLLGMYRAIGLASARVLELDMVELSPRVLQAVVHWGLHDGAGDSLYDFNAMYTLVTVENRQHIAAIAHNEIPKYQACLSRLKAERT